MVQYGVVCYCMEWYGVAQFEFPYQPSQIAVSCYLLWRFVQIFSPDEGATHLTETDDDDFDYAVSGKDWRGVLDAVKNQDEDELISRLKELDSGVQQQGLVDA